MAKLYQVRVYAEAMRPAIPVISCIFLTVNIAAAQTDSKAEVLKVEAAFSQAKIHNDVAALDRILADDFVEINQWGARRDKAAMIALFRDFETTSLVPAPGSIRVSGQTAVLDGTMRESSRWKFTFVRTYVKQGDQWRLLFSVQAFAVDPNTMTPIDPGPGPSQPSRREVIGGI